MTKMPTMHHTPVALFVSMEHVDVKLGNGLEYRFAILGESGGYKRLGQLVQVTVDYAHAFEGLSPEARAKHVYEYAADECPVVKSGISDARKAAKAALEKRNAQLDSSVTDV